MDKNHIISFGIFLIFTGLAWLFLSTQSYADPVREALEEAIKLQEIQSGKKVTPEVSMEEALSSTTGKSDLSKKEKDTQARSADTAMSKDKNSATSQEIDSGSSGITAPEQKIYHGVENRHYAAGGNGKPSVFIYYPSFGHTNVDKIFRDFAEETGKAFLEENEVPDQPFEEEDDSRAQYELTAFYNLERPNPDVISVAFNLYTYTGGAHGNLRIIVFNYNLKNGHKILFKDLFADTGKALQLLSEISAQKLRVSLGDDIEEDMFAEGLQPDEANFDALVLVPDGIVVEFQPYQVGPWSIGQPHVEISLAELKSAGPNPLVWPSLASGLKPDQ